MEVKAESREAAVWAMKMVYILEWFEGGGVVVWWLRWGVITKVVDNGAVRSDADQMPAQFWRLLSLFSLFCSSAVYVIILNFLIFKFIAIYLID